MDLALEENSSWSNITDISQSALRADWYPDSKSGFSKLCVSTSHSHHPETMSVCMWLKQTYQEGCAVCSRAHPRKKLFVHKDTPQTANPSSQIPISHENLTHGLGLCLSIFFDWQMKFLRKTSVIQNHLILEPYQTNMRKNVWVCVHVVCVCVCVWQTHWIGTFSPILFTTDESTSFFAYTQRKYCDSFCLRLVKDRNHRGNPRTLFNILISKFILKRQNISSPESLTSDKPMNHSRER